MWKICRSNAHSIFTSNYLTFVIIIFKWAPVYCTVIHSGINVYSIFLEMLLFYYLSFLFPTSYAMIFSLLAPGEMGSQYTSISEAEMVRARTLGGASEGSKWHKAWIMHSLLRLTLSTLSLFAVHALTFLCWKHSDNMTERPLSNAVVHSHFHFKLGQGCDAVISVNISRCIGWCQHSLDPGAATKWAESHNIAKILSILLFLWNWLKDK